MSKIRQTVAFNVSSSSASPSLSIFQSDSLSSLDSPHYQPVKTSHANEDSVLALLSLIDKLQKDLNKAREAKQQLASLYKVSREKDRTDFAFLQVSRFVSVF